MARSTPEEPYPQKIRLFTIIILSTLCNTVSSQAYMNESKNFSGQDHLYKRSSEFKQDISLTKVTFLYN